MNSQVLACRNESNVTSPVSWVLFGFVLFVTLRLGFLGPNMLADPDTYLHVAIGDWIRQHGVVPLTDPFSYPMAGKPWIAHEWLAGLVMSYAYTLGGWYGVCVLAVIALGLTLVILARFLLRHLQPAYVFLLVVLANVGLESHLLARPHVLVWPLTALWVGQLLVHSESGRAPPYWLLPLLVVWANLHGSFSLGLAFIPPLALEAYLNASQKDRWHVLTTWIVFLSLAIAACLITPFGLDGLGFTSKLVAIKSLDTISEWRPITVKMVPLVLLWLALFLVLGLRGLLTLSWIRLALILGLGWQMFSHLRFYSIFSLLVPMLVAEDLSRSQRNWPTSSYPETKPDHFFRYVSGPSNAWSMIVAVVLVCVACYGLKQPNLQPIEDNTPSDAVSYIKKSGLAGQGVNFYNYGGFLIWSGIPVFMDGRIDLRGDEGIKAYDAAFTQVEPKGLSELLDENKAVWTLFPRGSIAVANLDREQDWIRAYEDKQAVIHVRRKKYSGFNELLSN